jgi:Protein of unknown function (DUF3037)
MTARQSLYSIIQFRPDEARAEGVNVGVVVTCPSKHVVKARFSSNNEAAKKRFGRDSFDDVRLTSAKRALASRLERIELDDAALRSFIAQEAGSLVLLEPRPVVITDLDEDLANLFEELVGEKPPEHRMRRPKAPNLANSFESLLTAGIAIERDVSVELPGLPAGLHFPYAFKNGKRNFIKPQGFALGAEEAVREAKELGADGHLLAKHPEGPVGRRLIVVGAFANADLVPALKDLFADFDARLFTEPEIPMLLDEIRKTAHR